MTFSYQKKKKKHFVIQNNFNIFNFDRHYHGLYNYKPDQTSLEDNLCYSNVAMSYSKV
jgi:hypothetical protein